MDPQQRLLLEKGYEALHDASLDRTTLGGSGTGVFVGKSNVDFFHVLAASPMAGSVYEATCAGLSVASGRVSFILGLHGPCAAVDTACSAGLVAGHAGLRSLQLNECNTSLVAAVALNLMPRMGASFAVAGMTSPRGRCHTFDARADGYVRGEACGSFVLRDTSRSTPAAVLTLAMRGSAVRQDGRSASLTAPSGVAQRDLLVAAIADSGLVAEALNLNEAHGTGTALGDPIEAGSLAQGVLAARSSAAPFVLGGVKASIGHAEPAAGMTGLLKLVAGLCGGEAVANAQLRVLNPHLLGGLRERLWVLPAQIGAEQREVACGGVSSFGYSGTIAHAVIERRMQAAAEPTPGTLKDRRHTFRRRAFYWVESSHRLVQEGLSLPGHQAPSLHRLPSRQVFPSSPASLEAAGVLSKVRTEDREASPESQLVDLAWVSSAAVGVLQLNDPSHFNALGSTLVKSLAKAVQYAGMLACGRSFVLQAAGPHFCVGANPFEKHSGVSLTVLAGNILSIARQCCLLRELPGPLVSAVHGHLAGGGIALSLNASYMYAACRSSGCFFVSKRPL